MSYQIIEIYINGKKSGIKDIVSVSFSKGEIISFSKLSDSYHSRLRNYTPEENEKFELYVDGVKKTNPDVYITPHDKTSSSIIGKVNKKPISDLKFHFKTLELYSFKCKNDVSGSAYTTFKKSKKEDSWKIE